MKVDSSNIIVNPYLNNNKNNDDQKNKLKQVKKDNKQERTLKREGIYQTIVDLKKEQKLDKKLKRMGLDVKNIIPD